MEIDQRIVDYVAARLSTATTAVDACRTAVKALGDRTPAMITVLLHVRDQLRLVGATGSWQVYAAVRPGTGVSWRVFDAGKTEVVTAVDADPDYISLGPSVAVEICTPIFDAAGRPIGVFNVEWPEPVDVDWWRDAIEEIAKRLGVRIDQLSGTPGETRSDMLLRHAAAMTGATTERELLSLALHAAREVAGLDSAVLVMSTSAGARICSATGPATDLEARLRECLRAEDANLDRLLARARRHGASYSIGDPAEYDPHGLEELTGAGVRTMIAIPIGPEVTGGALLVVDEAVSRPDPATVNQLGLLAAQAWTCLDRLRTLERLHERASSDPLTGLRHHGPFGERLLAATPGRTALLAIDVDGFKAVNDTYGHQAGDRVLVDLARALETALRNGDELYRIGGDEFVAVVDVQRTDEAVNIAERLSGAARRTGRTISIGVAMQGARESSELTLRRADAALYEVKREGRNGVRLADPVA
ncbi:MAG TPA: diguanylate cyclase [Micromonosporaceae bacterium]